MRARISIMLLSALVLTGCSLPTSITAQVPTSGPIEQGEKVSTTDQSQFIRVIAQSPQAGMSPVQIVQGFLEASASLEGDHQIAREYLTPQASVRWQPGDEVRVFDGPVTYATRENAVTMNALQVATIDEQGSYRLTETGRTMTAGFVLAQVAGEWRIKTLPQGLQLSKSDVDRTYRSMPVYFFDQSMRHLVPDARMIPLYGPAQATTLTRYLLEGASDWLAPAVRTGVPQGVGLNLESVPVVNGVAQVDLSEAASTATDEQRVALSKQVLWTLKQLFEVRAVSITTNGRPFPVPGVVSPTPRTAWPEMNPDAMPVTAAAYVAQGTGVVRIAGTGPGVEAVPGAASTTALSKLAVSPDQRELAGITGDGVLVHGGLSKGDELASIRGIRPLSAPQFDAAGEIWVVDRSLGLVRIDSAGVVHRVEVAGLLKGSRLLAAVPARDGSRAALIVRTGVTTTALIARVVRTDVAVSVEAPLRIADALIGVADIAWANADGVLVLAADGETVGAMQIELGDGATIRYGAPEGSRGLAAAPGLDHLIISGDGRILAFRTGSWQPVATGEWAAYPG